MANPHEMIRASARLKPEASDQHSRSTFQLVIAVTPDKLSPAFLKWARAAGLGMPNFSHRDSPVLSLPPRLFALDPSRKHSALEPSVWFGSFNAVGILAHA